MKRTFVPLIMRIAVFLLMLSVGSWLFAGSQGWIWLPQADMRAYPVGLLIRNTSSVIPDPNHDYWIIMLYHFKQQPIEILDTWRLFALPIPIHTLELGPLTPVDLW